MLNSFTSLAWILRVSRLLLHQQQMRRKYGICIAFPTIYIMLYQSSSQQKKKFTQMRWISIGLSTLCCFMHPSKPFEVSISTSNFDRWAMMHSFHFSELIMQGTNYELKHHNTRVISCLELLALLTKPPPSRRQIISRTWDDRAEKNKIYKNGLEK